MARPSGAKNKRTLIREQRIRQAAQSAAETAENTRDPRIILDSLAMMEVAMQYFYGRHLAAVKKGDKAESKADAALLDAVRIAEKVAPYQHPRLSAVKVAADTNEHRENKTAEEFRNEIVAKLAELGIKAEFPPLWIKSCNTKPN